MSRSPDPGAKVLLTIDDVARAATAAGFRGSALVTAVAVSCAENESHDPAELGDVTLETAKWGPSVGLWQIRSLKADFGTGRERDQVQLTDPAFNARSAYSISGGGQSWKPWSTFTSGRYKQFMTAATQAVGRIGGTVETPVTGGTPIAVAAQGGSTVPLTINGRSLSGDLGDLVIGGSVDLSTSEVSEVSVTLLDVGYAISQKYQLDLDSIIHCLGLPFRVTLLGCGEHPAGATITLTAQPAGAVTMRIATPAAITNISPTAYMERLAKAAGLQFYGRPSGSRSSVGPNQITDGQGHQRPETSWEVGRRLADELGYYAFEAAGTYYFAPAAYIQSNSNRVQLVAPGAKPYPTGNVGKTYDALSVPTCTATISTSLTDEQRRFGRTSIMSCDVKVTAAVSRDQGEELRPAMTAWLPGASVKFAKDGHVITRVQWDLADPTSPVRVEAGTLAAKLGTAVTAADSSTSNDVPGLFGGLGTKSALDFVTLALRQVGDKYVWGAHPAPANPDPSEFDCSGLVGWASGEAGVPFDGNSTSMLAAIRRAGTTISVDEAKRTRGALLFHPGHVVISLGDGQHTIEAMGRKYGVVQGALAGRSWTAAGKIPGMVYP